MSYRKLSKEQLARAESAAKNFIESSGHFDQLDANDTAFLAREIVQLREKSYEVAYAPTLAETFLPFATDIAPSAEEYTYKIYDSVGKARIGAKTNTDAPRVDVFVGEGGGKVFQIDVSYGWGINEMEEAARVGMPLSTRKAKAATDAVARAEDECLAFGDLNVANGQNLTTTGFLNNANVTVINETFFDMSTDPQVIADKFTKAAGLVVTDSKQTHEADTLLLPTPLYQVMSQKRMSAFGDKSILQYIVQNNPHIKNIEQWYLLDGAGASSKNRCVLYKRSPDVLEGVRPARFRQLPPQLKGFELVINCFSRCGGVKVYQPMAMRYIDVALS
jgi:hypothetical protein